MMLLRNDVAALMMCASHMDSLANITSFLSGAKIHHFGFADTSLGVCADIIETSIELC